MTYNAIVESRFDVNISTQTDARDYLLSTACDQFIAAHPGLSYQINLDIGLQSPSITNWYDRIQGQYEPFPIPLVLHVPIKGRFLNAVEQKVFHRALQRSVKFVD